MKKVLLVFGLMMFLVGCKNGKNSFDEQAIKEIENSKYVEAMCEDLGVEDVEIEILDKDVKKDSAEVECEVTYKNDYVIGKETLICEMEKEDGKWEIDDIDSEEELECEPIKFPDKVEFKQETEDDETYWIISADSVLTSWYSDELISIGSQFDVLDVEWSTYDVSEDYTEGLVDIIVKIKDYEEDVVYSGKLEFDSEVGHWIIEFEDGDIDSEASVYYLNFTPELDWAWRELAEKYEQETGVSVNVLTAASGMYETVLESELEREDAPTLFHVSGPDGIEKWNDYCYDLSNADITKELTTDAYTLKSDGKVYGVGYAIESYGIIVNKVLLKEAGYELSDIASFEDLKAVAEDITANSDELGFSAFSSTGMDSSSDWRFKTHLANLPIYFEYEADGINSTEAIKGDFLDNYRDIFDLYINNSTCDSRDLSFKTGDDSRNEFLSGEAVFYQNGTWEYYTLAQVYSEEELAIIPIYMGVGDEANQGLCTGTERYWCVNKNASMADIQATLDFMYWCVTSEEGINAMADDMGLVIPFKKAKESYNLFVRQDSEYTAEGKIPVTWNFSTMPSENWKNDVGSALTAYAADPTDDNWEKVEEAFVDGWASEYKK